MKILLTGVTGQLGGELLALLSSRAQVACIGRNRPVFDVSGWRECDLSDAAALASVLDDYKPELIINAAAYTAVDLAETEPGLAHEINSMLPERLARWCRENNSRLIHYSTDYVFDGDSGQAYLESDKTNPQNVYGKSKLAGEQAITKSGCQHIIIRTAWIYSSHGKNFVLSMLNLAQKGLDLKIVNDQVGSPTSAINLAIATNQIVQQWWTQSADQSSGVYHYRDDGVMSWYDFAADIFRLAVKAGLLAQAPSLAAIPGSQFLSQPSDLRIRFSIAVRLAGISQFNQLHFNLLCEWLWPNWSPLALLLTDNLEHEKTATESLLIPVILSGGAGTRLWPVSRRAHPKPFMELLDGETLAEKTLSRARAVAGSAPVITVTSRDYYFYTRDLYDAMAGNEGNEQFLLEPMGRNTAPAIALAALSVRDSAGGDALMLVMPADHLVADLNNFEASVREAAELANEGYLVTFGIHPTHAETGYGYIRQGRALSDHGGFKVAEFVEKPNEATANAYLKSGEYHWNSGMFCFKAQAFLDALAEHAPEVLKAAENVWSETDTSAVPIEFPAGLFSQCPSISVDYAVMERAENTAVVVSDFGWSDIGSWKAISELYESDKAGNRISGKAIVVGSTNCFIQSQDRIVAAVGVKDLVIVDTGDAVLIADRHQAQDVKQVVEQLAELKHEAVNYHKTVHRPWGSFTVLEDAEDCKVKRLIVKPGQVLSLQKHQKRSEHWTVVQGTAKVRLGDDEFLMEASSSTFIPVDTLHRLENPGQEDIHLIEVQTGSYFGEDDIVRYEDIYGRIK